ncbi:protein hairless isoform X1 [Drosophila hydei]|uniref:Protein hairless isoform X1 n=2 Tax=Drosophila hydei TaxID=7224 RepID=A0A6J1LYS0_DROHY|nr:protein hairless isoform X1 [Drosophila hydei]XP_023172575.1 protein hairless isoform X1 [Drosophila hydei]XP_023172576.1 protein hairless isoform X1 [Drosophila hydei]XP_023172577.1 protein hairless isoform X1 [Drosophila hydei]
MTDERNGNDNKSNISTSSKNNSNISPTSIANHSSSNSAGSSSNNERLIAEAAAKFLLKNGINGTNTAAAAAAATLLTAAAAAVTFQLPAAPELKPTTSATAANATNSTTSSSTATSTSNGTTPTLSSTKTNSSSNSSSSSLIMATASATALVAGGAGVTAPKAPADVMAGVLDYSALNSPNATKSSKFVGTGNGSSSFDMGRHPISMHSNNSMSGYGGRLQFFKDGKFILELARAKDGDKGGWVSVPRKPFRTPSAATSATVTPTSAVTTTYPKNENSTSLSFSDDNSSIQSSPWQRDQPWKQTRPRRGISKELSLYYQRPRYNVLSQSARQAAMRKRRRPYEPTIATENHQSIFERVSAQENGDETLKAIEVDTKAPEIQSDDIKSETIKEQLTEGKAESDSKACSSDNKDLNDSSAKAEATLEKMNTSEDEDAMSVTVDDGAPTTSDCLVNGNTSEVNGEPKAHTKCETASEKDTRRTGTPATKTTTMMTDIRLKKQKPRAKLNSIIQKLIDGVPARLEQLSKTPAVAAATASAVASTADRISSNSSGGGAIGSLSHSLAHKVSPPSSAAAASRLVEYHHHHQHVSPRKRILREFEKVSLEDNNGCVNNGSGVGGGISGGAGGKRSRAKGSTATSAVTTKSMPINLAPPQAKVLSTPTPSTTSVATATVATQPTRLNSSYSIHSLLGGSGSSSSKKSHDQPAAIISNVHHQHHHSLYASSASYPRSMLNSPNSPEMGGSNGGKSPSHAATKKQRSPPYAAAGSPLPIDYGRRTPPDSYKLAQAHAQQLQHHSFYAPYSGATVSPHIPQAGGGTGTRDLLSPPRSSSASPREPATASVAVSTPHRTVPKKTASIRREFASPTASNSNSSSTANSCPSPGERSTSSPERRHLQLQRGSPSAVAAAAAGSPLHYYMYPPTQLNGSGTASPHGIAPNATPTTSSTAVAAAAAAAAAAAYIPSVVSPSLYHPYISTLAALRHNPLWVQHYQAGASPLLPPPPPHPHSHPQTSSAAGSRLSPQSPYHPFSYNGVNAAAVAVAAAAAASAFGQPTSNPHLGHPTHPGALAHQNTPPTHLAEHRTHTPKLTDICTDQMSAASSHRTTISSLPAGSSVSVTSAGAAQGGGGAGSGSTNSVQSAMFQNSSLRNELSSDLPLNLSKH